MQPGVECVYCKEPGHRARDCPKERINPFACKNCKQEGHNSKECPEPRSAENVECRKCNETGHFSKDVSIVPVFRGSFLTFDSVPTSPSAPAATVIPKTIWLRSARSPATLTSSSAATARRSVTFPGTVPSPRTGPRFSATTARSSVTPSRYVCIPI